jgi:hypothetical protein
VKIDSPDSPGAQKTPSNPSGDKGLPDGESKLVRFTQDNEEEREVWVI